VKNVTASHAGVWTAGGGGTSAFDVVMTSVPLGATGNSTDFALTAGGGATACTGTFSATHYDATVAIQPKATGWYCMLQPRTADGLGVLCSENATAKSVVISYETGVSTQALINAAILAQCSYLYVQAAGIATAALTAAADGAVRLTLNTTPTHIVNVATAGHVVAYFATASTTIANVIADMAANPAAKALITASGGTGTTTMVTGDYITATALAGGITAVECTITGGTGWTVTATGTGAYTIKFDQRYGKLMSSWFGLQRSTFAALQVKGGAYDAATGSIIVYLQTTSTGAAINRTSGDLSAAIKIHFGATFAPTM
jgi:hypothetical protein